jgi:hypothetical protein
MNRTVAIVLTVVTALCCGLPGLGGICLGTLSAMGSQMPEVLAQSQTDPQTAVFGGLIWICGGLIGLVIPIVVGIVSFRISRPSEPEINEPFPPAS